ncbi:breast cancer type 1 susceptibility protein homolog isoform X2 [Nerophis ophidion]|uniref:breast cancer type 1 susceptibility protein homolog isoform X2 n=1 Tax=Nerophis ophidion TaxID=159077 RepID=UPI002ADF2AA1|nr:breast cancer type 1 susceptibility protein homolog isoform X2 [Nerophis ophidion]
MDHPNVTEVKRSIAVIWETLQCPICLELLSEPVSTKCDHQFCKFCMLKLLDNTKLNTANCPVCKEKITKRSLQESPGFQRLVTGLQAMIHAYEHDTGTNYFTGLAQDGKQSCVTAGGKNIQVNDVNMVDVNEALPSSHSSTIAALNGFAKVMGFEDSGHLTAESGIQDKVQTIESLDSVETNVKTSMRKTRGKGKKQNSIPVDSGPQRKSLRQKKKKDLEPDKSLLTKKRESVEKVAEWLMKVPAEGSLELEKSAENCNNLDNSGSSTSTLDVNMFNNNEENPKELPAKALEEQVFGATYKRERRTRPAVSLPGNVFTKPMPSATVQPAVKRHKKTSLTPTDFIKSSEEKSGKDLQEEPQSVTNDICMDILEEAEKLDELESDKTNCKAPSHVFQNRQPEQKLAKRLRSTGQAVDADLQAKVEMASSAPKKADKRKNNSVKRAPKPLVLVSGVQNEESLSKSKLPSEAVQVHIENYPSSEDQEVPVAMNTRKGRKLSLCSQKRGPKKDTSRLVLQTPEKGLSDLADGNACKSNGCIFEEDIGAIENIEISETASSRRPPHLVEEVSEASVNHDPLVFPSSINPNEDPALHQNHSAPEEKGEDNSEVDTEQLLKSFKATKRKSFHFGALNGKKSCSLYDNVIDLTSPTCSDFIPPTESQPPSGNKDIERSNEESFPALLRSSVSSALSPNKVAKCGTESSYVSVVPQVVDSGICFNAVERDEIPESLLESSARDDCRTLAAEKHSIELSQHLLNVESSLTPDGLLGPLHGTQSDVSQELSGQLSMHGNPRKSRRRRTQKLQSSSESESGDCVQDVADTGGCEGHCVAERPPTCPSPDCVSVSQGSVDLFDSPDKCDVQGNGTSLSAESSQFTSEVLVTQQKLEMKKELVRLEKLMALVSEVLQEKEAIPAAPTCPDMPVIPCDQEANQDPDRETLAEGAQDGERVTRPNVSEHDGPAEMLVHEDKENKTPERDCSKAKMVLVSSGLAPAEQMTVKRFAKRVGARVVSQVTAAVTHIVMCTDEQLVCERTLKYFLGIASRKWVVSFLWISECFKQKKLLDESKFEVRGDVVNGTHHLGPTRARTTDDDNLLMRGYEICFQGPFTDMTTDELEWMVQLCGAAVVKDPLLLDNKRKTNQLVIVQPGSAPCSTTYSSLSKQATVVTRGWLLDTVATYTLQTYANYQT